jgi:hypothetical protein
MKSFTPSKAVISRLRELNFAYCWSSDRDKPTGTNWGQVNAHLWRIRAMYEGGDVLLAGWPNAQPHQRLFPSRPFNERRALPAYR